MGCGRYFNGTGVERPVGFIHTALLYSTYTCTLYSDLHTCTLLYPAVEYIHTIHTYVCMYFPGGRAEVGRVSLSSGGRTHRLVIRGVAYLDVHLFDGVQEPPGLPDWWFDSATLIRTRYHSLPAYAYAYACMRVGTETPLRFASFSTSHVTPPAC